MVERDIFYKIYWKIQSIIVPNLKYSQSIYEDVLKLYCKDKYVWLDLGCGRHLLPHWRYDEEKKLIQQCKMLIGLDYDIYSLKKNYAIKNRVNGDISKLPFTNKSFDLITANMVFEHLRDPEIQLSEIYRILKPGGVLIFHTPNILGYTTIMSRILPKFLKSKLINLIDCRKEEDIFPTYYRLNSQTRINKIARDIGFEVEEIKMIVSAAQFVIIPPLVVFELLWIRLLMNKKMRMFRTNIIARFRKPDDNNLK